MLAALAAASAVIVGPSNPVISIGPMLAVPGLRAALAATPAPVVAVSPLVEGAVLKGPTAAFMAWAGHPLTSDGVAARYAGLLDGLVADARAESVPTLETDVRARRRRRAPPRGRGDAAASRWRSAAPASIARTCARPPSSP